MLTLRLPSTPPQLPDPVCEVRAQNWGRAPPSLALAGQVSMPPLQYQGQPDCNPHCWRILGLQRLGAHSGEGCVNFLGASVVQGLAWQSWPDAISCIHPIISSSTLQSTNESQMFPPTHIHARKQAKRRCPDSNNSPTALLQPQAASPTTPPAAEDQRVHA